jgi:hypothetical protein
VFGLALVRSRVGLNTAAETFAAIAVTFLLGWVYTISAVQFAAFALVWRLLTLTKSWSVARRIRVPDVLWFVVLLCGVTAAIALHPRLGPATLLGSGEGYVDVRIPRASVYAATILLLVATVWLGAMWLRGRLRLRSGDAFIALCGGIAGASFAQIAAFSVLGLGSHYIVYKHIFSVCTLLLAALIVAAVHSFGRSELLTAYVQSSSLARYVFVPATLLAFVAANAPWQGAGMAPIVRSEAFARTAMQEQPNLARRTLFAADSKIVQMAFTSGLLHVPFHDAVALVYPQSSTPQQRADLIVRTPIDYAVVAGGDVRDPQCVMGSNASPALAIVRYPCQFGPAENVP